MITGYVELAFSDPWLAAAPKLQKPFTLPSLTHAAAQHLCQGCPALSNRTHGWKAGTDELKGTANVSSAGTCGAYIQDC